MKCLICSKEFEGEICPRCGNPVVHTPNFDAYIEQYKDMLDKDRSEFFSSIDIGILTYSWKDDAGFVKEDQKNVVYLGSVGMNKDKTVFIDSMFARIPDTDEINITVSVKSQNKATSTEEETQKEISLPNINESGLQKIGIQYIGYNDFRVVIQNENGKQSQSAVYSILD